MELMEKMVLQELPDPLEKLDLLEPLDLPDLRENKALRDLLGLWDLLVRTVLMERMELPDLRERLVPPGNKDLLDPRDPKDQRAPRDLPDLTADRDKGASLALEHPVKREILPLLDPSVISLPLMMIILSALRYSLSATSSRLERAESLPAALWWLLNKGEHMATF